MDVPSVQFKSVSKRFSERGWALRDLSFSSEPGEIITILGPSGCGKSTLLRLIAGLTQPTEGTITRSPFPDPEIGYIFQDPILLPWASVRENILLPLRLRGDSADFRTRVAEELAALVGLSSALDNLPRQLSGGMQMRVSLARALALNPGLLLLDEPFGALDAMTRNRLNEELLDLHQKQGWSAFFVTHSITEAVFLSSRILIINSLPGKIAVEIKNPLPFPRSAETRLSPLYQETVIQVTKELQSPQS